jgi:NIPSNAP
MPTEWMLRDYQVKAGEMEEWLEEWRAKVCPLRLKFGFKVVGAWKIGDDRFLWVLAHEGKAGSFQKANEDYYSSRERKAMKPDPARHLLKTDHLMMTSVMP